MGCIRFLPFLNKRLNENYIHTIHVYIYVNVKFANVDIKIFKNYTAAAAAANNQAAIFYVSNIVSSCILRHLNMQHLNVNML